MRDPDGLAQSSRNRNLTDEQRAAAVVVPRSLDAAVAVASRPGATASDCVAAATDVVAAETLATHEYTTAFDADDLTELGDGDDLSNRSPGSVRIATAVWFGDVRLIDNRALLEHLR